LNQALDYWNAHRHPYVWKKKPQAQLTILGGYSVSNPSLSLIAWRENHLGYLFTEEL